MLGFFLLLFFTHPKDCSKVILLSSLFGFVWWVCLFYSIFFVCVCGL